LVWCTKSSDPPSLQNGRIIKSIYRAVLCTHRFFLSICRTLLCVYRALLDLCTKSRRHPHSSRTGDLKRVCVGYVCVSVGLFWVCIGLFCVCIGLFWMCTKSSGPPRHGGIEDNIRASVRAVCVRVCVCVCVCV